MHVPRKLSTALHVWRSQGLLPVLLQSAALVLPGGWWRAMKGQDGSRIGRLVELSGNWVGLDGLRYHLGSPAVPRETKCLLALGTYEYAERRCVREYLPTSLPAIELGGCLGVVSCLVNSLLDDPDMHVVVEANPDLISTIARNREANGCHFRILNGAIAYDKVLAPLAVSSDPTGTRVVPGQTDAKYVPTMTVAGVLRSQCFEVASLVCDIEGSEVDMVAKEADVLGRCIHTLIMEVHPRICEPTAVQHMYESLSTVGFVRLNDDPRVPVFRNRNLAETV